VSTAIPSERDGNTAGLAQALVVVLRAQGVLVDEAMERRIARCQNREALLAALVQRAVQGPPAASRATGEPKDPAGLGSTRLGERLGACRDPAELWQETAAGFAAGLASLRERTAPDPAVLGYVQGLALIQHQMEAATPQFQSLAQTPGRTHEDSEMLDRLWTAHLFPVIDNLRRGQRALHGERGEVSIWAALRTLIQTVEENLGRLLAAWGLSALDPQGQRFDPTEQEAIAQTDEPGLAPGHVSHVFQLGFRQGARLVRPAQVGVVRTRAPLDPAA
jgi:hypothetical protein